MFGDYFGFSRAVSACVPSHQCRSNSYGPHLQNILSDISENKRMLLTKKLKVKMYEKSRLS